MQLGGRGGGGMNELKVWIRQEDFDRLERAVCRGPSGRRQAEPPLAERQRLGIDCTEDGLWVVRARIPAGRLHAHQIRGLAEVLRHYSHEGAWRLTERQGLELAGVTPERTPTLLRHLALLGISTRDTTGNTLRSMTICPMAGICPSEPIDVTPHMLQAARRLARDPLTRSLPRKLKIGFAGCGEGCSRGTHNDITAIATQRGSRRGFRLAVSAPVAGGCPVVVEELSEERVLFPALEAAVAVYRRWLDRSRSGRSRLDFLVRGFAADGVLDAYHAERARRLAAFDPRGAPRGRWREPAPSCRAHGSAPDGAVPQSQAGRYAVPLRLPHGELDARALRGLDALLRRHGLPELRLTPRRDVLIPHVREGEVASVLGALSSLQPEPLRQSHGAVPAQASPGLSKAHCLCQVA
jgi:sulfite reductase (ferredoxin)